MESFHLEAYVVFVFVVALVGFFFTKMRGFGRYTTSLLVLIMVLFAATVVIIVGKTDYLTSMVNLMFAIAGYAGGLISSNEDK